MGTLSLIIFWLFFGYVAYRIAENKGRSGMAFMFVSIILSPVIGIILALVMPSNQNRLDNRKVRLGQAKKCPYCAELVNSQAVVCKHCGKDLPVNEKVINEEKEVVTFCAPDSYDLEERIKNINN
jgi:hypothetical protein